MRFTAAYRATDGSLWLANGNERWHRSASGALRHLPHPPHLRGHNTQAMTLDAKGRMWISVSRQGLFLIEDGVWRKHGGLSGMPDLLALTLTTDRAGRVWAGFLDNQIAAIDGERVRMFGQAAGLDLGNVQALLVDGDRLWASGQRGLAWYDGRDWHGARTAPGLPPLRGISGMVRTGAGELWLHGSDGISRIGAADVAHLWREPGLALSYERFDAADGLVGSAEQLRPLPSLTQGSDGRLWFATASDVASMDPATIVRNRLAPPVQVLSLHAGEDVYDTGRSVQLPIGQRDLRIAKTALGLAIPERLRFRYRLEGFDTRWQDAGTRREAAYTNLPPGNYRFHVIAANEDGVWNDAGATLELRLPPRFVETDWFIVLMVLAGAALLGLLYWLRVRHVTGRLQERMQARMAERERIARGLHDTLLQSVQGLIMLFDQQVRKLPISATERARIEQTLELADELMAEGRDCILDLRSTAGIGDLERALCQYGGVLLQQRFSFSGGGAARALCADVREEVQAIAREALFNAARHARASIVELMIDYRPEGLSVLVRDNGCGMSADLLKGDARPRHYGIAGMGERAAAVGGRCIVQSTPGSGTTVQLDIPAERAYPGQRSATLFSRMRQRRRHDADAA